MGRRGTYFLAWWIWGASTAKKQMQTEDDSYFCVEIDSKLSNTLCHWIQISSLIIIAVPIQDTLPTTDPDWFCALNLYLIDSSLQNDTIYVILILMLCTVVSPICGNYTKFTKRSTGTLTSICVLEKLFQVLKSLSNPFSSWRKWWRIIFTQQHILYSTSWVLGHWHDYIHNSKYPLHLSYDIEWRHVQQQVFYITTDFD